jgi:hypothetical protein
MTLKSRPLRDQKSPRPKTKRMHDIVVRGDISWCLVSGWPRPDHSGIGISVPRYSRATYERKRRAHGERLTLRRRNGDSREFPAILKSLKLQNAPDWVRRQPMRIRIGFRSTYSRSCHLRTVFRTTYRTHRVSVLMVTRFQSWKISETPGRQKRLTLAQESQELGFIDDADGLARIGEFHRASHFC